MKKNKILIIMSIFAIVSIVSAIFGYLYTSTDIFKSDSELFIKYILQNIETIQNVTDVKINELYRNLKNENSYESNTNIKIVHSEGGEVSNPLNNLEGKIDIQKNDEEQYLYADAQILYANEEYLETEIIKQQDLYGIRFTDVVKQFITVKDDGNIEIVAKNIGISSETLKQIMNVINGTSEINEIDTTTNLLKDKYFEIIKKTILEGTFSSLKNAMITYNNETIKTNSYSLVLSSQQIKSLIIELLNNAKIDMFEIVDTIDCNEIFDELINTITEENKIPDIKITVYEQKEKTIRTMIEIGSNKIILENTEENGELKNKIQFLILNNEQVYEYNIQVNKKSFENQETFAITIEKIEAEDVVTIDIMNEVRFENNKITSNSKLSHKKGIIIQEIKIENIINIGQKFDKKQILEQNNNVLLNDLSEERQKFIIDTLKENVPIKFKTRLNLLAEELILKSDITEETEDEISQIDINKFNAKFEFYAGDAVSSKNVKDLLEIIKNNIANYEIIPIVEVGEEQTSGEKSTIKLYIEQNKQDENAINKVLEKIDDKNKYKVSIFYKQSNGLIDYIIINEV